MAQYLMKRIFLAFPVILGISIVVFAALRLAPGDPARAIAGLDATPEFVETVRVEYGLDKPMHVQFASFVADLAQLNLGKSIRTSKPVLDELLSRYPTTILLAITSTLLAAIIGISLGVGAAYYQHQMVDYGVMALSMAWLSIPNFVLGIGLIYLFAVTLGWLPSTGSRTWLHFVLPVITVSATGIGIIARQTRSAMLEVLSAEYIRTARAKGLSEPRVLFRHALRNALVAVITIIGVIFGQLLAGTVIVETLFGLPGVGRLMIDSINARDYPVVQGAILIIAFSYVVVNIIVDLVYVVLDRRIKL